MIFLTKPKDFNPKFDIVSCFCEANGKILLLHRNKSRPQGLTWGVPAGKVEDSEDIATAIKREIFEETGIKINEKNLKYFGKVFVRYPEYDFVYHIFHIKFPREPKVTINSNEHIDFKWVTPEEALKLPLIRDLEKCIELVYKIP